MKWIFRFVFVIVFFVGIIGNSVVCWTVLRRKRMRSSNYIFTFNLAFSDLIFVVFYVPSQMAAYENNHNWALGAVMCRMMYVILPMCLSASVGTLLAITGDRYRAVAHPMEPRITPYTMRCIIALIWFCSFITALPIIVHSTLNYVGDAIYCDEAWPEPVYGEVYWISIFVVQYLLPLAIILILAILIAYHVEINTRQLKKSMSKVFESTVRQRMKQTSKIIRMLVALVVLYTICMLPQHIIYFWWNYGDLKTRPYRMYIFRFANVFPMANSAFNPIAYGTLNSDFKNAFKRFFTCDLSGLDSDESKTERTRTFRHSRRFRISVYRKMSDDPSFRARAVNSRNTEEEHRKLSLPVTRRRGSHTRTDLTRSHTLTTGTGAVSSGSVNGDIKNFRNWDKIHSDRNLTTPATELEGENLLNNNGTSLRNVNRENTNSNDFHKNEPILNEVTVDHQFKSAELQLKSEHSFDIDSSAYDSFSHFGQNSGVNPHMGLKKQYRECRTNNCTMGGKTAECAALLPSCDDTTDESLESVHRKIEQSQLNEKLLKHISSIKETTV